jgi:glycosyltransferase involved in cell wall biosynthesis
MKDLKNPKVAIVCDWLTGLGGAERVVYQFHKMYPEAPIYTSQYEPSKIDWFKDADIRTSWLQGLPSSLKKFLPVFRALYFSHLDLSEYDLVLISSGAEAKSVKTGAETQSVCYCHSPTHYYWTRYNDYVRDPGFGKLDWLARIGLKVLLAPMRKWDFKAAQKPDYLITNSSYSKTNIKEFYKRDATVIYPPVNTETFRSTSSSNRNGFVVAGRQTPYKKIELAVQACSEMNLDLTVIGNGPDHKKLIEMAGPSIKFVTRATDSEMASYFKAASAFIFPNVDDFGIVAVEALSSGTPVIAYAQGGSLDYITNGVNGTLFKEQTVASLKKAIKDIGEVKIDNKIVSKSADKFSNENFNKEINKYLLSLTPN